MDPLPKGARLTVRTLQRRRWDLLTRSNYHLKAILDSCHSGTLLDLDHYSCHWFLRRRTQCTSVPHFPPPISHKSGYLALQMQKAVIRHDGRPRRHTHDVREFRLVRSATQLFRTTFSGTVAAALAIVRFRIRLKKKKKEQVTDDSSDDSTLPSPGCIPRPPCGGWYCAYALLNGPLVVCHYFPFSVARLMIDDTCMIQISVSSCSDEEATWEDSQNKGKSMTTVRVALFLFLIEPYVYHASLLETDSDFEYASSLSLAVT